MTKSTRCAAALAFVGALLLPAALGAASPAASPAASRAAVRRAAPVSIAGAPRSLVSLAVPVPEGIDLSAAVHYRVERSGFAEVMGRLEGEVGGLSGRTQILLTVRVPSDARVGLLDAADVIFTDRHGRSIAVPIILRVPAVRAVRLQMPPVMERLQAGDRVELVFQLVNEGNAPERVALEVDAPPGWTMRSARLVTVAVGAFESKEVSVRMRVPAGGLGGEVGVPVRVRELVSRDSMVIASNNVRVQVEVPEFRAPGLKFLPYVATSTSEWGTSMATGFRVLGPISESVRLIADLQPRPQGAQGSFAGLGSVGAFAQPLQVSLQGRNWNASVGNASGEVAGLPGAFLNGDGVRADYRTEQGTEWGLVVARPLAAGGRGGNLASARVSFPAFGGRATTSVSRMAERNGVSVVRDLTAVATEWSATDIGNWDVTAGAALRRSVFGSGVGFTARAGREFRRGTLSGFATFAPGGSESYANARLNFGTDFSRSITDRWRVDGSLSGLSDRTSSIGGLSTRTLAIGNQLTLSERSALTLRATNTALDVRSRNALSGFGSSETFVEGGGSRKFGDWDLSASSRVGVVERSTELLDGRESVIRVPQQRHSLQLNGRAGSVGSVGLGGGRTLTASGAGIPAVMNDAFASFSGTPRPIGMYSGSLRARVGYMAASGNPGGLIANITSTLAAPSGFEVQASLERNSMLRTPSGRANLFFALRVTASTEVFVPRPLMKAAGVVFNDLNGNGTRDQGEPGVSGVVLRVDGIRVVSEDDGTYRVPANVRGQVRVDPLGLPRGFVVHASSTVRRERGDVALRQTGNLTLFLNVAADRDGVRPVVDVSKVSVWLTDGSGVEWVGRSSIPGEVLFENVPVGRYEFRYDFSEVGEPLRGEEGALVEVAPGVMREVTVTLRTREVRMIDPAGRGGRGGRGGSGGRGQNRNDNSDLSGGAQ